MQVVFEPISEPADFSAARRYLAQDFAAFASHCLQMQIHLKAKILLLQIHDIPIPLLISRETDKHN